MPTVYKRTGTSGRGEWGEDALKKAMNAVKEKLMGVNAAAIAFNIPKTTLKRRLKSQNYSKGSLGPQPILGFENEKKIVSHIKKLQDRGFSPCRDSVRYTAFELAEKLNIAHTFDKESKQAGYDWLHSFLARNPNVVIRKSEGVSVARAKGMNKKTVEDYFELLKKVMEENDLIGKPGHLYNMDETGLQLNNKPSSVLAIRGSKNVTSITSGEKGETISVVACVNGEGTFLPPYSIMKGKNLKQEFMDGMPPGSVVRMSQKSAYINSEIFLDWLKTHFTPRKPAGKVLIILDGHTSHTSCLETLEFAEEHDIILLSLPPHTSHWLQPLDRSFFKSLKSNFFSSCKTFMVNNPSRKINRLQFGKLLNTAWTKSASVENCVSGFKACGVIPLNMAAIPDYAYLTEDGTGCITTCSTAEQPAKNQPSQSPYQSIPSTSSNQQSQPMNRSDLAIPSTSKYPPSNPTITPRNTPTKLQPNNLITSSLTPKLTPTKILEEISPIPSIDKSRHSNRKAGSSKVLNSLQNIEAVKQKEEEKKMKQKQKQKGKKKILTTDGQKKKRKIDQKDKKQKRKNADSFSSSEEEIFDIADIVDDDEITTEEWDEDECVGCGELYNQTTKQEEWIKCIQCSRWSHEGCSRYDNKCDICGKREIMYPMKKIKKENEH